MKSLFATITALVFVLQPLGTSIALATDDTVPSTSSPCVATRAEDILWVQDFEAVTGYTSGVPFFSGYHDAWDASWATRDNTGFVYFNPTPWHAADTSPAAAFSGTKGLVADNPRPGGVFDEALSSGMYPFLPIAPEDYFETPETSIILDKPFPYRVSFWARTTASRPMKALFQQTYMADWVSMDIRDLGPAQYRVISSSWQCISVDLEIPAGVRANQVMANLFFGSLQPGYELYIDDYAITRR